MSKQLQLNGFSAELRFYFQFSVFFQSRRKMLAARGVSGEGCRQVASPLNGHRSVNVAIKASKAAVVAGLVPVCMLYVAVFTLLLSSLRQ